MLYNKYAYYKIENKNTGKTYHGIFDIVLNKIVFNTDEKINVFIPYSSNSMLAITDKSAYRICTIFNDNKDGCIEECPSGNDIILDDEGNKCGPTTPTNKVLLIPEGVYISSCDTSIYFSNGTHCGLCRDMDVTKPYKFINGTECISPFPSNANYYNVENQQLKSLNLLVCNSGYILSGNECIPHCYESCATCTVYSEDVQAQHCLTCIPGYEKESESSPDTNCLQKCSVENSQKCSKCNEESNRLGLCLSCKEGYEKVNYTTLHPEFLDCLKADNPILKRFYPEDDGEYKPCYKTCKKCLIGGTPDSNSCLECVSGYMLRPGDNPKNNCVAYSEYYYTSNYDQYKGLNIFQCPEEAKYKIKEKKSCIDDCKKDSDYQYLYDGNCLNSCPSGTRLDPDTLVCKDIDTNKCSFGENELYLENNNLDVITTFVKTYLSEFSYTDKHITQYQNENYTIIIYKKASCIKELSLQVPNVDFKDCYTKVQNAYNIHTDLVVSIADKKGISNPLTFYSFYHPVSGEKLDADTICAGDTITVKENLYALLDENNEFYNLQASLAEQGINIFDKNDPFYTDICYDFDNPYDRDIPLNDRIKDLYPNVSLCDEGCQYDGINLEDMSAKCDCTFNDISNNALIKDNELIDSMVGEIFDLINSSNILVLKCFKYMFKHFARSIGGWIALFLILAHIAMSLLYFLREFDIMKNNLLKLTNNYLEYISTKETVSKNNPPKRHTSLANSHRQMSDIIISDIVHADTKSDDVKIPEKISEDSKKEENNIVLYNNSKNSEKNSNSHEVKIKIEETQNNLNNDKNLDIFFEEYLATSPDEMEFDDAIVLEKRKFSEHLVEGLKEKQMICNTFLAIDDLKPRSIKIMVLILNVILYFVVNGLFFSESVIHELYEVDEDEENFFSYFPRSIERIVYCTIVSIVIGMITDFFFVQQIKVKGIFIREKEDPKVLKEKIVELINEIKKRNFAFIITVSVILLFSFFYLLCFNYVYPYSQIEWIKSSITIIIIMQLLSALKCLLESGLRYLSFKLNSEKLFKIGKILE